MLVNSTLVGYLGRDPEIRYTPNGQAVCNFDIAVTRTWVDAQGAKHEETEWPRITVWGKLAETCGQFLKKGRAVVVVADRFTTEAWISEKSGKPEAKSRVVFTAQTVKFLGGRNDDAGASDRTDHPQTEAPVAPARPRPQGRPAPVPAYEGNLVTDETEFPF